MHVWKWYKPVFLFCFIIYLNVIRSSFFNHKRREQQKPIDIKPQRVWCNFSPAYLHNKIHCYINLCALYDIWNLCDFHFIFVFCVYFLLLSTPVLQNKYNLPQSININSYCWEMSGRSSINLHIYTIYVSMYTT